MTRTETGVLMPLVLVVLGGGEYSLRGEKIADI